jgi:tripartite-type tricarboxylate transporter receptor subunit TctC
MRRSFLRLLAGIAAGVALAPQAFAAWPEKPLRIVIGFPAGSAADLIARALAPKLTEGLGQPIVIENRTGAGSSIAAEAVARAPADGYTFLLSTTANVINQSVSRDLKFDFTKDLVPVMLLAENPVLLVAPANAKASNLPGVIAAAKAAPGKMTFASSGVGTFTHLYGELFNQSAGIKLNHVPYRGSSQAMTDVLAGLVDLSFTPSTPVLPNVKAGKLKPIAVIGRTRMPSLPEVPTFTEARIPGFESALWFGVNAPAGTPPEIIERLAAQLRRALDAPDVKAQFAQQAIEVVGDGPQKFGELVAREHAQWARLVKIADIKGE